jgi:hypothetical protein
MLKDRLLLNSGRVCSVFEHNIDGSSNRITEGGHKDHKQMLWGGGVTEQAP